MVFCGFVWWLVGFLLRFLSASHLFKNLSIVFIGYIYPSCYGNGILEIKGSICWHDKINCCLGSGTNNSRDKMPLMWLV